jgi:hypothetical protein
MGAGRYSKRREISQIINQPAIIINISIALKQFEIIDKYQAKYSSANNSNQR